MQPSQTSARIGPPYQTGSDSSSRRLDRLQEELAKAENRVYEYANQLRAFADDIIGPAPEGNGGLKASEPPTGRVDQNLKTVADIHSALDSLSHQLIRLTAV